MGSGREKSKAEERNLAYKLACDSDEGRAALAAAMVAPIAQSLNYHKLGAQLLAPSRFVAERWSDRCSREEFDQLVADGYISEVTSYEAFV